MANRAGIITTSSRKSFHYSKQILKSAWGLTPTHNYSVQLIRSVAVSVVALVVNFGFSFVLKEILGVYYLLAATLSYCAGVIVNYYLSNIWVFAHRQLDSKRAEFIIFTAINLVGLIFNALIVAGGVEILHWNYWAALSVATIIVFFWNFLMRKRILY